MSGTMEALTAALEANTAIQEKVLAALKGGAAATGGKAAAATGGKAAAGKAAAGKKKATTVDDIAAAFGGYLGIKDKEERAERALKVKSIVDYFGVKKVTELDATDYDEALKYLQSYVDDEVPEFDGAIGNDDGDGDDDESLV